MARAPNSAQIPPSTLLAIEGVSEAVGAEVLALVDSDPVDSAVDEVLVELLLWSLAVVPFALVKSPV